MLILWPIPALLLAAVPAAAFGPGVRVVAAERAYADIAAQIAGPDATVAALLTNPALDPHAFEATPSTARAIAGATVTIANGLGYDSWMDRLAGAAAAPASRIVIGDLLHRQPGDNPHLCYDPAAMPALTVALTRALRDADPAHAAGYTARAARVLDSLAALRARIAALRAKVAGRVVAATEPVFAPMAAALGLRDPYGRFELSQMNATEPRAGDVAALQDDMRAGRVRVLFTNAQAGGPASDELIGIARSAGIPVVPVAETLPAGISYQAWIGATLDRVENALGLPP